jgi:GT2 family glycosyltransferase
MTEIAVVILNWNTRQQLERFLPNILEHSSDEGVEVIVADNGSTDDSAAFMKEHHPQVRLIEFDRNYGFTGGYNRALDQVEARYYVLLNSDVEVTPHWLSPMKQCLDENPHIAACMPKMKAWHNKNYFEYAGAAGGFIDKYGYPFCRGRILDTVEPDQGQYDESTSIFWATGACMFVRSEIFHQNAGFDDDFFAHMEEIDLCWRIKNAGYSLQYVPESTVYHLGGGTLPNDSPFKIYLNYRNNLFLLYKNLPKEKLIPIMATRMILDVTSSFIFLLKGKPEHFASVYKAHRDYWKALSGLKSKRKANPQYTATYPPDVYKKSILFSYFIRKQTVFSRIQQHIRWHEPDRRQY